MHAKIPRMAGAAAVPSPSVAARQESSARHSALVRITHWLTTLCFFALLVSGVEIVISHPRFYWGETGNVLTPSLFDLPIPASRSAVQTGYSYVLPDQNGWSRSLHFQAAWIAVFTGFVYAAISLITGHFRRNLLPGIHDVSPRALASVTANHLRFRKPAESEAFSYNSLQRLTYLAVIFLLGPLMLWTGLAMSPAIAAAFPAAVGALGGQQSARTIHFFASGALLGFLLIHVAMICRAGFAKRMRGMVTGRLPGSMEKL